MSPAVKASLLARAGQAGKAREAALSRKEGELAALLLERPALALPMARYWRSSPFSDPLA